MRIRYLIIKASMFIEIKMKYYDLRKKVAQNGNSFINHQLICFHFFPSLKKLYESPFFIF
jgi:hypothetical protein